MTSRLLELVCERCGATFLAARRTRYCVRHRNGRNLGWQAIRSCVVCRVDFWPRRANARACPTHADRDRPWRLRSAAGRPPRIRGKGRCAACGRLFLVRTFGQRLCSRVCRAAAQRRGTAAAAR